jgi:RNA polymerase sigma-70 factor (ECF subfamily)
LRIANNAAIDASRRRKADALQRSADAVDVALPPAPDPVELADLSDALSRALDALRPTWRTAIVLRYHEGCSYAEIAEVLGVPEGTAKTFVHRARSQMANMLTQAGWRP